MKRIVILLLISATLLSLLSCQEERDAEQMLSEFISAYGAEGIIYSSAKAEGEDGYLEPGMLGKIYVIYERFPANYAIFLNSHANYGSECAIFVCDDAEEQMAVEEASLERIRLLGTTAASFVKCSGRIVFYSTMSDRERAERIFNEIIK